MRLLFLLTTSILLALSTSTPANAQTLLGVGDATDSFGAKYFVEVDGTLYFIAGSFTTFGSIWKSDGTPEGTMSFFTPPQDGLEFPQFMMSTGDGLAFLAESEDASTDDLWTSNGTTVGTEKRFVGVQGGDFDGRFASSIAAVGNFMIAFAQPWVFSLDMATGDTTNLVETFSDIMFFQANDFAYLFAETSNIETNGLLRTDGTKEGTVLLSSGLIAEDEYVIVDGNKLIGIADNSGDDREIFVSDGTVPGSDFLAELVTGDDDIDCSGVELDRGIAYFGVANPSSAGCVPYRSDGTDAGTFPVVDTTGLELRFFGATDDYVFWAEGLGSLWRSDGTLPETIKLSEYGVILSRIVSFNRKVYFVTLNQATVMTELWESDGTIGGTKSIFTAPLGAAGPIDGRSLAVIGNRLYFSAFNTYYLEGVPTGTEEMNVTNLFTLTAYPNPFVDRVTIKMVPSSANPSGHFDSAFAGTRGIGVTTWSTVTIVDILGRRVMPPVEIQSLDAVELDLSGLAGGIYFARLQSAGETFVSKIVRVRD